MPNVETTSSMSTDTSVSPATDSPWYLNVICLTEFVLLLVTRSADLARGQLRQAYRHHQTSHHYMIAFLKWMLREEIYASKYLLSKSNIEWRGMEHTWCRRSMCAREKPWFCNVLFRHNIACHFWSSSWTKIDLNNIGGKCKTRTPPSRQNDSDICL